MSCISTHAKNHIINQSGILNGYWEFVLVTAEALMTLSCEKVITNEMIAPDCIIGRAITAVSLDKTCSCVQTAQDHIRFIGVAEQIVNVGGVVVFMNNGIGAAIIDHEMIRRDISINKFKGDIVLSTGSDKSIWCI